MSGADRPPAGLQQHDLHPDAARRFVAAAGVAPGDQVVEVGPGLGALTAALLAAGARVAAAELDPVRLRALAERCAGEVAGGRLRLVQADARRWRPLLDPGPWRVVANPPFQHTAELVRAWLLADEPPDAIDLIMQREAAQKWCVDAARGHTRSSVLLDAAGTARIRGGLPRTATTPPSRVDLAFLAWRRRTDGPDPETLRRLDALLAIGFAGAHSMRLALRGRFTAEQLRRQGALHRWRPDDHPRTLTAGAWLSLVRFAAR